MRQWKPHVLVGEDKAAPFRKGNDLLIHGTGNTIGVGQNQCLVTVESIVHGHGVIVQNVGQNPFRRQALVGLEARLELGLNIRPG